MTDDALRAKAEQVYETQRIRDLEAVTQLSPHLVTDKMRKPKQRDIDRIRFVRAWLMGHAEGYEWGALDRDRASSPRCPSCGWDGETDSLTRLVEKRLRP